MYHQHFGLTRSPFSIEPDPDFLWLGEMHKEGLATLRYGILENKGFLLLTGDAGTGKTVLIKSLLGLLTRDVIVATIPDPCLGLLDFFSLLSGEFQIAPEIKGKADFLLKFKKFVSLVYGSQKRLLIIIDEAQRLTHELLEEIRILSNIDYESRKLVNIFFVGQIEFGRTLSEPRHRALRQRITVSHHLVALNPEETAAYVRHRLEVAGTEKALFTPAALNQIFRFSGGLPRRINTLCDRALITAYTRDLDQVDPGIVHECARELGVTSGAETAAPPSPPRIERPAAAGDGPASAHPSPARRSWIPAALAVAAGAFLVALFLVMTFKIAGDKGAPEPAAGEKSRTADRGPIIADPKDSLQAAPPRALVSLTNANTAAKMTSSAIAKPSASDTGSEEQMAAKGPERPASQGTAALNETATAISSERQSAPQASAAKTPSTPQMPLTQAGFAPQKRMFLVFFKPATAELEDSSYETLRQVFDVLATHPEAQASIWANPAQDVRPELSAKFAELRSVSLKTVLTMRPEFKGGITVTTPEGQEGPEGREPAADRSARPKAEIRILPKTGVPGE